MLLNGNDYLDVLADIKARIANARHRTLRALGGELVMLYWSVGKLIDEKADWGSKFVETLAHDIRQEYPGIKGFSVRNLKYMQKFARLFPEPEIVQTLSAQLSWSHNIALMDKVKDPTAMTWYADRAIQCGWSLAVMELQIEDRLYERQALPSKTTNFGQRLPEPQSDLAREILKDPYLFDFIEARDDMAERELEDRLVKNVTRLLLELGTGFAFVGQQFRIEVEGEDFYIDLLFYHLKLRCYVVVELKTVKFRPEFAGQLNFYISAVDAMIKTDANQPTLGILLCKDKRGLIAEFALKDIEKPIGVSEYRLVRELPADLVDLLPSAEDIASRIGLTGQNDDA